MNNMNLNQLRKRVDKLDESLLGLLNQRGDLVRLIGGLKEKNGRPVFVPGRERALLDRLKIKNKGPLPAGAVEEVFREIVHACRSLQKSLTIAFFGPEATYTHLAAIRQFGRRSRFAP